MSHNVWSAAQFANGFNFGVQTIAPTGALYIDDLQQPQEPPMHSMHPAIPLVRDQGDSRSEGSSAGQHSHAQKPIDQTHHPYFRASGADTVHQTEALSLPYQAPLVSGSGGFDEHQCALFYATECPEWVYVNGDPCPDSMVRTQHFFRMGINNIRIDRTSWV